MQLWQFQWQYLLAFPLDGTITAPTVTVNAPAAYTWTLFKVGGNWSTDDTGSVVVTENSANTTNWQVVAQDVSATDYGFMRDVSNFSNALATKFEISKVNANSGLTYANAGITYTGTDNGPFDFYGYQNVTNGDAAGTYSITITFTATVTGYN